MVELDSRPELRVAVEGSLVDEAERIAPDMSAAWPDEEVLDERVVGAEWLAFVSLLEVKGLM